MRKAWGEGAGGAGEERSRGGGVPGRPHRACLATEAAPLPPPPPLRCCVQLRVACGVDERVIASAAHTTATAAPSHSLPPLLLFLLLPSTPACLLCSLACVRVCAGSATRRRTRRSCGPCRCRSRSRAWAPTTPMTTAWALAWAACEPARYACAWSGSAGHHRSVMGGRQRVDGWAAARSLLTPQPAVRPVPASQAPCVRFSM